MRLKKIFAILLAGMMAVMLAACAPAQGSAPAQESAAVQESATAAPTQEVIGQQTQAPEESKAPTGVYMGTPEADMVVLDVISEPVDINSMMLTDNISVTVLQHIMSGLMRLDENDNPVGDIAESWEINDDNTVYTFKLRQDAKWTNGDPVTANDFYFAWLNILTPDSASPVASYLTDYIKNASEYYAGEAMADELGIEVVDDYTLRVEWARPMSGGLFWMTQPFYFPINQKAYEEIGADQYAKDADKIVTNGPYTLDEWVHDDSMMLAKSEGYFDAARINIPRVKITMINDSNTRINAFMAGELDMANVYSDQIELVKTQAESALDKYIDGGSWYFSFNMEDPLISNVNLRKALAYSVDIQSLLDNVIADGSVAADGLVPGAIAGADGKSYAAERGSLFAYDIEAAKTYLEQALTELGITADQLELAISVHDSTYSQNQAAYVQQQWKQNLGIDVAITVLPIKALAEAKVNGEFQIGIDGWGPSENDPITFLEVFRSDNPNNKGKYSNAQYDELIGSSYVETDAAVRQKMLADAEKILMEDMAVGPMYFTCTAYVVSDKIEGLVRTPFQMFSVTNGAKIV